jgi:hypothetical protein
MFFSHYSSYAVPTVFGELSPPVSVVGLIVIGLIVQALVFAANSSHPKIKQNSRLN